MKSFFWWFGFFLSSLLVLSSLIFGISILVMSLSFNNPYVFVATFFSASLWILVSLSLMAGLIVKIVHRLKEDK